MKVDRCMMLLLPSGYNLQVHERAATKICTTQIYHIYCMFDTCYIAEITSCYTNKVKQQNGITFTGFICAKHGGKLVLISKYLARSSGTKLSSWQTRWLCRYRKRTDIYYSTWSFENVSKNCQFQFLDPHSCTLKFLSFLLDLGLNITWKLLKYWSFCLKKKWTGVVYRWVFMKGWGSKILF